MNRRHRPPFSEESPFLSTARPETTPTAPPYLPPVTYFNVGYRPHQNAIIPSPQNMLAPFLGNTEWTDRSGSSVDAGQLMEAQKKPPHVDLSTTPSQDVRNSAPATSDQKRAGKDQGNSPSNMKVVEKRKNNPNQKKNQQQSSPADKKTEDLPTTQKTAETKANGRSRRNVKQVEKNIDVTVRSIVTRSQTRDSRNKIPLREQIAKGEKSLRRGEKKVVEKEGGRVTKALERVAETVDEIQQEEKERSNMQTPEAQLIIEDQSVTTPQDQLLITDSQEVGDTTEKLVTIPQIVNESPKMEALLTETVAELTPEVLKKPDYPSKDNLELEGDLTTIHHEQLTCPPSAQLLEQVENRALPPTSKAKTPNFPKITPADGRKTVVRSLFPSPKPTNKRRYLEIVSQMDKTRVGEVSKKRYTMFLPTAFNNLSFTETTIKQLYGLFKVSDVCIHYNKNGVRLGSGSMKVLVENCSDVKNWAADRQWRAIRMLPIRQGNEPEITVCLMFLPNWGEAKIEEKLRREFGASKFRMLYQSNGNSTFTAITCMKAENAFELSRKLRSADDYVFEKPNTVSIYELSDIERL